MALSTPRGPPLPPYVLPPVVPLKVTWGEDLSAQLFSPEGSCHLFLGSGEVGAGIKSPPEKGWDPPWRPGEEPVRTGGL